MCVSVAAVTQLLRAVRNAMVEAFQRLPAYIASFTAHAALVVLTPEHGLYKPVNAFLLHVPSLLLLLHTTHTHTHIRHTARAH